ncbi:MAG: hypothetical protein R6W82_08950 [bacterium]
MSADRRHGRGGGEEGLALLGSLLLVSMLAVMSTAFLLIMAADVRIGISHWRGTQSFYNAESALSMTSYKLTAGYTGPADTLFTWVSGTDSLSVRVTPGATSHQRELRLTGFSGPASFDVYAEVLLPDRDPRTFYAVTAHSTLRLENDCEVDPGSGKGIWYSYTGGYSTLPRAIIEDSFDLDDGIITASGLQFDWSGVEPAWTSGTIQRMPHPAVTSEPDLGLWQSGGNWFYYLEGDPTRYQAYTLGTDDVGSGTYPPTHGSFGTGDANPMGVCVWDWNDGWWNGNITIDGTLYAHRDGSDLNLVNGTMQIVPREFPPGSGRRFPAVVAHGDFAIEDGWGSKDIYGLVYVRDEFYGRPDYGYYADIRGALVAGEVFLDRRTRVFYREDWIDPSPGPVTGADYPVLVLYRKQYVDKNWAY